MKIIEILEELNKTNSTNDKLKVLKENKENLLLQKVLKMTYDKVFYTFNITLKNISKVTSNKNNKELFWALNILETDFITRKVTGNKAKEKLIYILESVSDENKEIIKKIINRDLKINIGRTQINKVWKNLIIKPVYNRCDIYTEKTAKKIEFPAIIQLKSDGTYRELSNINNEVNLISRSGENSTGFIEIKKAFSNINISGYFLGEMIVKADNELREKYNIKGNILPRSIGNGLINSDNKPFKNIIFEVWDYITEEDYKLASLKDRKNPPKKIYKERFNILTKIIKEIKNPNIKVVEYKKVNNISEAINFTSEKMKNGFEGAILKDYKMIYKDGTNKEQLKMKICFELDVMITGFIEGKKGTKREKTFGAITYKTTDEKIKGSVSGFTDKQLIDFNKRRQELIGSIIEIEGNDITQAKGNNFFAISHPRFIELRTDKDYTDSYEIALLKLESAKEFK